MMEPIRAHCIHCGVRLYSTIVDYLLSSEPALCANPYLTEVQNVFCMVCGVDTGTYLLGGHLNAHPDYLPLCDAPSCLFIHRINANSAATKKFSSNKWHTGKKRAADPKNIRGSYEHTIKFLGKNETSFEEASRHIGLFAEAYPDVLQWMRGMSVETRRTQLQVNDTYEPDLDKIELSEDDLDLLRVGGIVW